MKASSIVIVILSSALVAARSFVIPAGPTSAVRSPLLPSLPRRALAAGPDDADADADAAPLPLSESDQGVAGAVGTAAALVVLGSEAVLKTTGCGLPAGPAGLIGATEGLSYLSVVGLVALSLWTKVRTGKGLPPGPGGLLGAAEGLSFLAAAVGAAVLGFQLADYGYIPNAVPMEGGMCK